MTPLQRCVAVIELSGVSLATCEQVGGGRLCDRMKRRKLYGTSTHRSRRLNLSLFNISLGISSCWV
jgi:hypothetical protein